MDSFHKVGGSSGSGSGSGIRQRSGGGANKLSDVAYTIRLPATSTNSSSPHVNSVVGTVAFAGGGVGLAYFMMTVVCPRIPYAVTPEAAERTYTKAGYSYDPAETHFDNTIWTYGTDYFLCLVMSHAAMRCFSLFLKRKSKSINSLPVWSGLMLSCYATSVLAGGLAHQFYSIQEKEKEDGFSLNSLQFRILWTICVGTVTLAGGMMGACGSAMARQFQSLQLQEQNANANTNTNQTVLHVWIPVIPESFWVCYGVYLTFLCARGDMSFTRPACDIFIAGTTQFPPTAYVVGLVLLLRTTKNNTCKPTTTITSQTTTPTRNDETRSASDKLQNTYTSTSTSSIPKNNNGLSKIGFSVGFFLNAPLLPMYPILVQYSGFSLGTVNTILHTNLLCAWSLQAHSLYQMSLYLLHNNNNNNNIHNKNNIVNDDDVNDKQKR